MSDPPTPSESSCKDEYDPQALSVDEAQQRIDAALQPLRGTQRLPVRDSLGGVLAQDIIAPFDIPSAANSAMDGYALRAADLDPAAPASLEVIGESYAGRPSTQTIGPQQALRIMTGALLPQGADTVVMQEEVTRNADRIIVNGRHRRGANVRLAGQDLSCGSLALPAGKRLNAADIGLLASMGLAEAEVRRIPTVAFFSTGDELQSIGQPLAAGQLYDSNRYTLYGLLKNSGVSIIDLGVVRDELAAVRTALATAAECADLILTSGGVSVGDADYVKRALADLGEMDFWKIAVKPGRPLAFGRISGTPIFGLPGNPVSVATTFLLFVRRAISRLAGEQPKPLFLLKARSLTALRKTPGRTDFQRGVLHAGPPLVVETTGLQGSHMLSSLSRANCFIVLPRDSGDVLAGAEVDVVPFEGLL